MQTKTKALAIAGVAAIGILGVIAGRQSAAPPAAGQSAAGFGASQQPGPDGNLVLASAGGSETHVLNDAELGVTVSSVTTPAGWRFDGQTSHTGGSCASPPDVMTWRAESPDGGYASELGAGMKYGSTNMPQLNAQLQQQGCIAFDSPEAEASLRNVWLPRMRAGARIEAIEPLGEASEMLQQAKRMAAQSSQSAQGQGGVTVSGGHLRIAYDRDGRTVEEDVTALNLCTQQRTQNMMGPATEILDCTLGPVLILRAPAGKIDAFVKDAPGLVRVEENPGYGQKLNQLIASRGAAERQQIVANGENQLAQTRADNANRLQGIVDTSQRNIDNIHRIGNASMQAARRSADALHDSAQAFGRSMGDRADYTAPNGQTFSGSNQYSHTYVGPNGQVVQTNSAYAPGADWTETQGR